MKKNKVTHWAAGIVSVAVISWLTQCPLPAQTGQTFFGFESPDVVGAIPPGWYQMGNDFNLVTNTNGYLLSSQSLLFTGYSGTLGWNLPAAMPKGAVDFYANPTSQELTNDWVVCLNAGPNMTGNGGIVAMLYGGNRDWFGSYNEGASAFDSGSPAQTNAYNHVRIEWDCTGSMPQLTWIWNDTVVSSSAMSWSDLVGIGSVSFGQGGQAPSGANLFLDNVTVSYPALFSFETDTVGATTPIGWYSTGNAVGSIKNTGAYSGSQCLGFSSYNGGLGFNFTGPMKQGSVDFYVNPTTQVFANEWCVSLNSLPNMPATPTVPGTGGIVAMIYTNSHNDWQGSTDGGLSAFDSGCPVQINAYNHLNIAWDCTGAAPKLTWTWNNGAQSVSTITHWTAPEGISSIVFTQGGQAPSGATCSLDNVITSFPSVTYFSENFDETNPPSFTPWYWGADVTYSSTVSTAHAFSPSRSAYLNTNGISYFDLPLTTSLAFNRASAQGIGGLPLYVSARIWPWSLPANTETCLGLKAHIQPLIGPPIPGQTLCSSQSAITQSFNGWQTVAMDVGAYLARQQQLGLMNPDEVVIEGPSIMSYGGGTFYVDNVQLATSPPPGWTPPVLPSSNGATYRADSVLQGMVLHGAYYAIGDPVLRDWELHPAAVRDMKRHYLNFAGPGSAGISEKNSSDQNLAITNDVFSKAQTYNFKVMPTAYIGNYDNPTIGNPTPLQGQMQAIVQQYSTNPNISPYLLAWYLRDEPLLSYLSQYLTEKQWIQQVDSQHSVLAIFNDEDTVDAYGGAQSVIFRDIYPIVQSPPAPANASNPWSVPVQMQLEANEFTQPLVPVVLVDQTFSGYGGYQKPTLGQFSLMVYGALAQGAKGLLHFPYTQAPVYMQIMEGQGQASPIQDTLVDPYGTTSDIYSFIGNYIGPDLMSIGELLRTCHPAPVPSVVTTICNNGTMLNAIDQPIPTIATTMLSDAADGYNIIAVYNNDPNHVQTGTLTLPSSWVGSGNVIVDLTSASQNITQPPPAVSSPITLNLLAGAGHFWAVLPSGQVPTIAQRMQATRFTANVSMVNFDITWLNGINQGNTGWTTTVQQLQTLCNSGQAASALTQLQALDTTIQTTIANNHNLSLVLSYLNSASQSLSNANQTLSGSNWTYANLTPPAVGAGYGSAQTQLGQMLAGYKDLVYQVSPAPDLAGLASTTGSLYAFIGLCSQHCNAVKVNAPNLPTLPDPVTQSILTTAEASLTNLHWIQPAYMAYQIYKYP